MRDSGLVTSMRMGVMPMTYFESMTLLMQLATVMIGGFSIVVSLVIFFAKKK
jgi:hypothetical protein